MTKSARLTITLICSLIFTVSILTILITLFGYNGNEIKEIISVTNAIDDIGVVTIESGERIAKAEKQFGDLSAKCQMAVVNRIVLTNARTKYDVMIIEESKKNYESAINYEKEKNYHLACNHFALVAEKDNENYTSAREKLEKLEPLLPYIENCAKAWVAAETTCSYFSPNKVKAVYYGKENSAYEALYGKGVVTIVSEFLSTDCTFIISSSLNSTLAEQYPYEYSITDGLYIHEIGVDNYTKGWLSDGYDVITDTYVSMAKYYCDSIDIEVIEKYIHENYISN